MKKIQALWGQGSKAWLAVLRLRREGWLVFEDGSDLQPLGNAVPSRDEVLLQGFEGGASRGRDDERLGFRSLRGPRSGQEGFLHRFRQGLELGELAVELENLVHERLGEALDADDVDVPDVTVLVDLARGLSD